ncbi:MAG: GerMN domain-containing protein [Christensenellales bacterium]|jgi:hypothetical protein
MRQIIILIIVICVLLITAAGCSGPARVEPVNTPDINPKAEAANKDTSAVTLYFSYRGENFLAGETRTIDIPVSDNMEAAVVRALIEGPSADKDELVGLFWDGIKLVGVDSNEDYLFVTLSEAFVSTDPGVIALEDRDVHEQKKLAIYSIVNTLIEMGKYSRVQIYVDREGGVRQRITLSEAGWTLDSGTWLEPLPRDSSLILTPENTLKESLKSFGKKDWVRLYNFIAYTSPDGTIKPDIDAFSESLAQKGNVLEDFSVIDSNVSFNGQSAVVMLNYSVKTREGDTIERTNIPVEIIREDDIWKLLYTSLVGMLINIG